MSEPTAPSVPPFPWVCPNCRKKEVRRATIQYQCERLSSGQPIALELADFSVPQCGNCGELVFDYEAEEQINQAAAALNATATDRTPPRRSIA